MLCSFKYNSLCSISCKTTPSQRKEKATSKLYFKWSKFLYVKNYKIKQKVSFFFPFLEENNKEEQNHHKPQVHYK